MQVFAHKPVMLAEVIEALRPSQDGVYVDGTVGGGGHAEAILEASSPRGRLLGCDRDKAAVEAARRRLERFAGRFEIRQMNFAELDNWVPAGSCSGMVLDLGVSSAQLDQPERGFSFQHVGPLDMRMDTRQDRTAADLVNTAAKEEMAYWFWHYGGEREARRFAEAIVARRQHEPFRTTQELAELIEGLAPRHGKRTHPATRTFQALRMVVNNETDSLERGLETAVELLKCGGRLAVITFHSLEDRLVKEFGRARARDYTFEGPVDVPELRQPRAPTIRWMNRKAMKPGESELAGNPRSRSAQLRVLEKL